MANLLLAANCTVTIAHSRTRDLPALARTADILVAAVGRLIRAWGVLTRRPSASSGFS
jgi:5,10-methylene-tetrahydrofolate dehydrogenase/methenyl tetrahydrofolate cyclohydrolase